jgi:adenylosuccinate lyase
MRSTAPSASSHLQKWLDAEAALAIAEGELGVIPKTAADGIARKASAERLEMARAVHLGIEVPDVAWHVARDGIADWCMLMSLISGTCVNIAHEVIQLQKTEVAELEEPTSKIPCSAKRSWGCPISTSAIWGRGKRSGNASPI